MIRLERTHPESSDRCTACFDNRAAVTVSIGREDERNPGRFAPGGYSVFSLCGECAQGMSGKLTGMESEANEQ